MRSFNSILREVEALNRRLASHRGFQCHAITVLEHAKVLRSHATEAALGFHHGRQPDLLMYVRKRAEGIEAAARSSLML